MAIVLDSTFLIHLLRGEKSAIKKIKELEEAQIELATTQINVFELVQGIYCLGKDTDLKLEQLEILLRKLKVLELDHSGSFYAGRISGILHKKGLTVSPSDILIASIALTHKINQILTRNNKDFSKIPEIILVDY